MKIALAQLNPTVGDIAGNEAKILAAISAARADGADLVLLPELAIPGYPPKDLLLKPKFIADQLAARDRIAAATKGTAALIGFAEPNRDGPGNALRNSVVLAADGEIVGIHRKSLLPTYDVFDESRYFEPADRVDVARLRGRKVGVTICEDLWNDPSLVTRRLYTRNPVDELAAQGAELLLNASASPFVLGKHDFRRRLFGSQAAKHRLPLAYCNQVGGNDELVFDGCSVVFGRDGQVIAQAKDFDEDLLIADLDHPERNRIETPSSGIGSIHKALVLGLRDYVRKTGFKSVVLGLSGGIDSAVTVALAAEALGRGNVVGVAMPSRYSSDHSVEDARAVAANLGVAFHIVPIADVHAAFESALAAPFAGRAPDVTEENLQARCRGVILMAFSNKFGHLLLTTGNKSELAVGYCTLYGDMCGGLAVISDVPKTMIWELARWINRGREIIPVRSITKPPSAELRPNQTDQDSLPPYEVLDAILERYVEQEKSADEIVSDGFDSATVRRVIRLVDLNEYKRKQAAPGLKVTSRAFGFGRRMPIAQRYGG
jgi:NAD+ synthetase